MNWISTSERMPESGDKIVLCFGNGVMIIGMYGVTHTPVIDKDHIDGGYQLKVGCWCNREGEQIYGQGVTHWMPLPDAPRSE
ncbi:MAG: DUF551 domain-containing protein [Thiotrichaceae bacterium]